MEEICPGVIWRVWKRDVFSPWTPLLLGWILFLLHQPHVQFFKKFHGGLGGKILTLPMLWFHSYRSAKISNICVANLSEVLSASLQYHCAIGRRYPPWPFWINSVGFPPFFFFFFNNATHISCFSRPFRGQCHFPSALISMRLNKVCQLQVCVGAVSTNDSYSQLGHRRVWFFLLGLWYMSRFKDSCT